MSETVPPGTLPVPELPAETPPSREHTVPANTVDLRGHLVDTLTAARYLTTSRWRDAFRTVPRDRFFDRFSLPSAHGLGEHDLADPGRRGVALAAIYTDNEVHRRPEHVDPGQGPSPAPSLLATMLEQLGARPGDHVLEIGTANGYPAALLSEALGDRGITTVGADPTRTEATRVALAAAGYHPAVLTGEPTGGCPRGAPYDRMLATNAPSRVPGAWVPQLRTGGVLVADIGAGAVRLTAREDGSADGPFLASARFAPLRSRHEGNDRVQPAVMAVTSAAGEVHDAAAVPRAIFTDRTVQFLFLVHHPELRQVIVDTADGTEYYLHTPSCGSWARVVPHGPGRVRVTRGGGPTDLWHELGALIVAWNDHGRPRTDRYGLTVRPDGTHLLWLDERARPVAALGGSTPPSLGELPSR